MYESRFFSRLTILSLLTCLAMNLTACQRFKQSQTINQPSPLVKIDSQQPTLSPVFSKTFHQTKSVKNFSFSSFSKKNTMLSQGATAFQTVLDSRGYISASANGMVLATNLHGEKMWEIRFGQGLLAGVAIDNQKSTANVVVVSDVHGKLIAIERLTGKVLWQTQLSSNVLSPALISGNRVVALSNNGFINGISLQTGEIIWQFATNIPTLSVRGSASPIILDSNTVLVATADGRVHALNLDNGNALWSQRMSLSLRANDVGGLADIDATPVLVDNLLYVVSFGGQLLAWDINTHQIAFSKEIASLKSVNVDKSQVYATTLDGSVIALDKFTGRINWESDSLKYRGLSNAVSSENTVIIGDKLGFLHIFDKYTGKIIDRKETKIDINKLTFQPLNQTARVIVQSQNGDFSVWQVH